MFPIHQFSPNWFSLPMLLSGISMLVLGLTVAIREHGSRVGMSYLALAATICIWLFSYSVMYSLNDPAAATWWIRVAANFGVTLLPAAAYHLANQFVPSSRRIVIVEAVSVVVSLAYWLGSVLTHTFIQGVQVFWWGFYAEYGWLGFSFIAYLSIFLGASLLTLIAANRNSVSPRAKMRTRGLALAYLAGYPAAVDFVPVFGIPMYPFGYLFIVAFIVLTARIVWKYQLVDVTPKFASTQIIATMSEGLLLVDADGIIRVVNHIAEQLLVSSNVRLANRAAVKVLADLPFLHGTEVLVAQGGASAVEFKWTARPGEPERVLRAKSSLMYDARRVPAAVVCLIEDVTEEIRAADSLRATNRQLAATLAELGEARTEVVRRERFKALGEMVTGIAHDFNNALTPILGFAEMLTTRSQGEWTRHDVTAVNAIYTSAQDAAEMIARLREWYRPSEEHGAYDVVDVSRTVETVVTLTKPVWETRSQARQVTIEMDVSLAPTAFVSGVEAELREVLTNLIINAVDAMPAGGTISISTVLDGSKVLLDLSDTGTGMDEATLARCFDPFYSTKGDKGTGLGLPMVKSIVERHEGTIEVESTKGVGTTFHLVFPAIAQSSANASSAVAESWDKHFRVLVVDDIPASAHAEAGFLEAEGHHVEVTTDPLAAREALERDSFDFLVTDLAMPKLDGLELCRIAKSSDTGIKTVIVTGFSDLVGTDYFDTPDVDAVARKPLSPSTLRAAMFSAMAVDKRAA